MNLTPIEIEEFWKRIPSYKTPEECWDWEGTFLFGHNKLLFTHYRDISGIVPEQKFRVKRQISALKILYELTYNEPQPEGTSWQQTCGNERCININHLKLINVGEMLSERWKKGGPDIERNKIKIRKGLKAYYAKHGPPKARCDEDDVRTIRALAKEHTPEQIALATGLTKNAIINIIKRVTWKNVY